MIISKTDFLYRANLDHETLEVWIEEQWLIPQGPAAAPEFSEVDLARASLIRDLQRDLGVNHEGVGVILHLLDQIHSLRHALASRRAGGAGLEGSGVIAGLPPHTRSTEPG
jgi:chaperone modulatory protein CbpM